MHVYLDDIFVYSNSVEDHEWHLKIILDRLRDNSLYLKWSKCNLYAKTVDCLSHIINDQWIHPDADKMARIHDWHTLWDYNDVQQFIGLVNYVKNFLPDITAYTSPLLAITQNGTPFNWWPIHQRCFEMIKRMCCKTPIIKPIDPRADEPIWVICDASKSSIGAMYGQGPSWQKCCLARFMSKKFTMAQQNYAVHELETLAILKALLKWEDKLIGYCIHIITDHRALELFKTQTNLSPCQMFLFDFDITYVKGELNKVVDCLSCYFENDEFNETHEVYNYGQADAHMDPLGEDLLAYHFHEIKECVIELWALHSTKLRWSHHLVEQCEACDIEAQAMAEADAQSSPSMTKPTLLPYDNMNDARISDDDDITLADALFNWATEQTPTAAGNNDFLQAVQMGYKEDNVLSIVINTPGEHRDFTKQPPNRMYRDIHEFFKTCELCQCSKSNTRKPLGKLHSLPIPTKPWDSIGMDFISPFPESKGFNYLWVILCCMMSMTHLIPIHTKLKASEPSWLYMHKIVHLHGLPRSIVSNRDSKFTSKWWKELHKILGAKLLMSTSFHLQTNGQTECVNWSIGQIFHTLVCHDQKDWVNHVLDMTKFAINTSVSGMTSYASFKLNRGYMPSMIRDIHLDDLVPKGIKSFA